MAVSIQDSWYFAAVWCADGYVLKVFHSNFVTCDVQLILLQIKWIKKGCHVHNKKTLVRERSKTTSVIKAQVRQAEPVVPPKATTSACEASDV